MLLSENLHHTLLKGSEDLSVSRISLLRDIAHSISSELLTERKLDLVFICTHNSRRSQFAQFWAYVFDKFHSINRISSFSGGTEATAVNQQVIDALSGLGYEIEQISDSPNPHFKFSPSEAFEPLELFSKRYDHSHNPSEGFIAIMVCSDADQNCPFVPGARHRFALPFEDPKSADGSPNAAEVYSQSALAIAQELFFVFEELKNVRI